jgi:hypothetical protein
MEPTIRRGGFDPNKPYWVWGDSGTVLLGSGGNGVVGSSAAYTAIAGFSMADDPRAAGVFGTGPRVGVAGVVQGATSTSRSSISAQQKSSTPAATTPVRTIAHL